jgi:hypothetical protein
MTLFTESRYDFEGSLTRKKEKAMSEVCVINTVDFERLLQDPELHTEHNGYNSPIGDTQRVLDVLRRRGYELWTTPNPDVWLAVKEEEQLAVLRQKTSGNDTWHLTGAAGDVTVTPEEVALCLRLNSEDRTQFLLNHPESSDEDLQRYVNWSHFQLNDEELNAGVLSTNRSRHHFACCMHFLDKRTVSTQEMQVGMSLVRKLEFPTRLIRI